MIIYKTTNKINGKIYIGQTIKKLYQRKSEHIRTANRKIDNNYFHNAIRKYGKENFKWKVIEECKTKEELNEMEFHYIKQHKSHVSENGYNLTFGGDGASGYKISEETRIKMSECRKGEKHPMYGKVHPNKGKKIHTEEFKKQAKANLLKANLGRKLSEEHKEKIRQSNIGKKISEEHKEKIRQSNHNRIFSEKTKEKMSLSHIGKKLSEKTKRKISESLLGRIHSDETKLKISNSQIGEKNSFYGKKLTEDQWIKKHGFIWKITHINGKIEKSVLLTKWCRENNISKYKLKKSKEYKVEKIYISE